MDAFDVPLADIGPSDWSADSPTHRPARRWLRARYLFENAKRVSRIDDDCVRRARNFLASQARSVAEDRGRKPALPDPTIGASLAIARDADPMRRGEFEAYLLTMEPVVDIGRRLDLPAAVVATYHDLFFEVRDRPHPRDWLTHVAVGCGPWNDFAGPQPTGTWKYAAWSGGAPLLELLIPITAGRPFPTWIRQILGEHAEEYEKQLRQMPREPIDLMLMYCRSEAEKLARLRAEVDRFHAEYSGEKSKTARMLDLMAMSMWQMHKRNDPSKIFNALLAAGREPDHPRRGRSRRPPT